MKPMTRSCSMGYQLSPRSADQLSLASSDPERDYVPYEHEAMRPFGYEVLRCDMQATSTEELIQPPWPSLTAVSDEPSWVEALRRDLQTMFKQELSQLLRGLTEVSRREHEKQMDMEKTHNAQIMTVVEQSCASKEEPSQSGLTQQSERMPLTSSSEDVQTILTELRSLKALVENAITNDGELVPNDREHPFESHGSIPFGEESTSGGTESLSEVLQAVMRRDISTVRDLVDAGLDPKIQLEDVGVKGMFFTHLTLVAAAVRANDPAMVDFLVDAHADPESKYGLRVGPSRMEWYGPASFMAISRGRIPVLQSLVRLRASLDAVAKDGSNLVWHAAHYDKVSELKYLLDHEVDCNVEVAGHDKEGVTYTPLHIAIVRGNVHCVLPLINAKAKVNGKNEEGRSPLHDAIKYCHPRVVCHLVSSGAELFQRQSSTFSRNIDEFIMQRTLTRTHGILDDLILMKNPVLIHAAAVGIQNRPHLARFLSLDDVDSILATPGKVKVELLKAIFVIRKLRYRDSSCGVHQIKTAVLGIEHGAPVHPIFPHVVSSPYSSNSLDEVFKERSEPDSDMMRFIHSLAPQQQQPKSRATCHVPVRIFECVVPGIDQDLRILGKLAASSKHQQIWLDNNCWAIFTAAWRRILWIAKINASCHLLCMGVFCIISYCLMEKNRDHGFFGFKYPVNVQVVASLGLVFWFCELLYEVMQILTALHLRQHMAYLSIENFVGTCRLAAAGMLLVIFCSWDGRFYGYGFRCLFGFCCFFKWIKALWTLSPFRRFGFRLLPLLHAMRQIGPFAVMMMFYLFGLAHAFTAWDILKEHTSNTIVESFFFGMLGDRERIHDMYQATAQNSDEYFVTSLLVFLAGFLVPVSLMNLFVAQLGYSYGSAMNMSEKLFRHRLAQTVASHSNMYYTVRTLCGTKRASISDEFGSGGEYLWYCDDNSEAFEKGVRD